MADPVDGTVDLADGETEQAGVRLGEYGDVVRDRALVQITVALVGGDGE